MSSSSLADENEKTKHRPRARRYVLVFGVLILAMLVACAFGVEIYFGILNSRIAKLEQRIRDMGQPVTLEELAATYPEVPAEDNAALVYSEALALLEQIDPKFSRTSDVSQLLDYAKPDKALPEVVRSEVEVYVNEFEPVYVLFDIAVTKPRARFEIDFSDHWAVSFQDHNSLRQTARMEVLRSSLAIANGDLEQAVQCQRSMLSMAESVRMEPVVLSQLSRLVIWTISVKSLEYSLSHAPLPESGMRELMSLYKDADDPDAMIRAFIGDLCATNALLRNAKLYRGNNPIAGWLRSRSISSDNRQRLLAGFEPLIGLADTSWPGRITFWSENGSQDAGDFDLTDIAGRAIAGDIRCISAFARGTALTRMAQTGLAIELHRSENGDLPDSLGLLVPNYLPGLVEDPFDGQPLRYARLEAGYRLYSVYEDQTDNDGAQAEKNESGNWHGDWVFEVRR